MTTLSLSILSKALRNLSTDVYLYMKGSISDIIYSLKELCCMPTNFPGTIKIQKLVINKSIHSQTLNVTEVTL